jgi:hypothetical protein
MSFAAHLFSHFLDQLTASITNSPLLRVNLTRTSRLLDCARLRVVDEHLPEQLLAAVIGSGRQVGVNLQLRATTSNRTPVTVGAAGQSLSLDIQDVSETESLFQKG